MRLLRFLARLMRARAHWRDRRRSCVCCGVYENGNCVCFHCYYRWTFDGWRPWWLQFARPAGGADATPEQEQK